jgi:hypothetical protein
MEMAECGWRGGTGANKDEFLIRNEDVDDRAAVQGLPVHALTRHVLVLYILYAAHVPMQEFYFFWLLNIVRTRTGPEPRFRFRFTNLSEPNIRFGSGSGPGHPNLNRTGPRPV